MLSVVLVMADSLIEQNEIFEVGRSSHLSIMPGSSWKSFLAASSISLSPSTPTLFSTIILQSCTEVLLSKSMKLTTICLFFCSVFRDGEQNRIKGDLHFQSSLSSGLDLANQTLAVHACLFMCFGRLSCSSHSHFVK